MFAVRLLNILPVCQPLVGVTVDVLIAYSTFWLPGLVGMVTTFTIMLFAVGVPLGVGAPFGSKAVTFCAIRILLY